MAVLVPNEEGKLVEEPDPVSGAQPGMATKITWEDVELLANDPDAHVYILKVDLHQAEEITHVLASKDLGDPYDISFALRPDGDARPTVRSGYGESSDRLFEQYNLPVPQILDLDSYQPPRAEPSPFVPAPAAP